MVRVASFSVPSARSTVAWVQGGLGSRKFAGIRNWKPVPNFDSLKNARRLIDFVGLGKLGDFRRGSHQDDRIVPFEFVLGFWVELDFAVTF